MKYHVMVIMGILLFLAMPSGGAEPAPDEPGPRQVLQATVDEVLSILNDSAYRTPDKQAEKEVILFEKADQLFDFRAFAMGALGRNWQRFSETEKTEFIAVFSRLIGRTYFAKIEKETLEDLSITYLETQMLAATKSGRRRADVFSEVRHNGVVTPVDYRMLQPPGGMWKIYDVKIEGVSLLGNYREQYRDRFMDSPDVMIEEVRQKVMP